MKLMAKPLLFGLIGLIFAWLCYERYWKWRFCIDESLSSCVTPDGSNLTSGGLIWGVFAFLFIALAVVSMFTGRSRR
jgi:hypothetical protein